MSEKKTIAFDIDGTWTLNPAAWLQVFRSLRHAGFNCIFVTGAQQPREKLDRLLIPNDAVIIYSYSDLKKYAAKRSGYDVAVWIDDMPGTIEPCRILQGDLDDEDGGQKVIRTLLASQPEIIQQASREELIEALLDAEADQEVRDTAQAVLEARKYLGEPQTKQP